MQNIKTVNVKGKQYVTVAERVRLVHEERESFEMVESKPMQMSDQWVWQAVVLVDGKRYIGTAEVKLNAPKNTADGTNPWACAETSAVGRALGFAGLGTLDSICTAEEVVRALSEQSAPVTQPPCKVETPVAITQVDNDTPCKGEEEIKPSATDDQKCAIIRLCKRSKSDAPRNINSMSRDEARDWIALLQKGQIKAPDMMKAPLTQNKAFSII
jgi:hypothetical protein